MVEGKQSLVDLKDIIVPMLHEILHDDVIGNLGQTVNVCFAGTIVTTFYRIVEQTVNGVAVVLVILCSIPKKNVSC